MTGSQDTELALAIWSVHGHKLYQWREENLRIHDVAISADGNRLAACSATQVRVYDYHTKEKLHDWSFDDAKLTSLALSKDCKTVLVSLDDSTIKLIDIESGETLHTFTGHTQTQFVIRSSFGGAGETFIVSGSEGQFTYTCVVC